MRIGIVGAGRQGCRRIKDLLALGEEDLMVWEPDPTAMVRVASEMGVRIGSPRNLWDWQPEALLICTPPGLHLDYLREAYAEGVRAMFVEKPLALSISGVAELEAQIAKKHIIDFCACNWRFHNGPSAVKAWLKAGVIGEPRKAEFHAGYYLPDIRPDWKTCYVKDTGVCLDVGWHMVDLALDWFGPATLDESHLWACRDVGWPDTDIQAALYLKHDSGMQSLVTVDLLQAQPTHFGTVYGLKRKAGYSLKHQNAFWRPYSVELGGESIDLDSDTDSMMRAELAHFLDCARAGRQTVNPISKARETLAILLEAKTRWRESSR